MGKICEFKDCKIGACFGYEKDNKCVKCKTHKDHDMINIKFLNNKKKCVCGKNPFYGYKNDDKPTCCSKCKKEDMVNIVDKRCECGNLALYSYNNPPIYCSSCKKDDMFNLKKKNVKKYKCDCGNTYNDLKYKLEDKNCCYLCYLKNQKKKGYCDCGKRATFGINEATHCSKHKTDEMTDIKNKNKLCQCSNLRMLYGYEDDKKPSCCINCKKDDMIDLHNFKARCKCSKKMIAIYGYRNDEKPTCCYYCKKEDMRNIRDPICKNIKAKCEQLGNRNYKGYCTHCFSHIFPDDPLTLEIRQKTKEIKVRDFINENYEGFIHDKPIYLGDGCDCTNRRRIDLRKIIGNTMLAIECDEFQHKRYDKKDEKARYDDMYMVFSGKWYYIRFNPDSYKDKTKKNRNPTMPTRLKELKNIIDKAIEEIQENNNEELVKIVYLYYDEEVD